MSRGFTISEEALEEVFVEYLKDIILDATEYDHPDDAAHFLALREAACVLHNNLTTASEWLAVKHLPLK